MISLPVEQQEQPQQQQNSQQKDELLQREKRKLCWQQSIRQRTEAFLSHEIGNRMNANPILTIVSDVNEIIQEFRRNEIKIGTCLGKGAFSEVYDVQGFYNTTTGNKSSDIPTNINNFSKTNESSGQERKKRYVIKHLSSQLMTSNRKNFLLGAVDLIMEAKFLSKFNHENIIKIRGTAKGGMLAYGDGSHNGFFLILDRVDETLSQRIDYWKEHCNVDSNSLSRNELFRTLTLKIRMARQVAAALDYMHGMRIMYRDLKPGNIGIVDDDTIKMFDFGLCRELPKSKTYSKDDTFLMSRVGTQRYMAPEVSLRQAYNDSADVYSFAIVLYEMFSLQRPFESYTPALHQLLVCEGGKRLPIGRDWPSTIQNMIASGWSENQNERWSMAVIHKQLEFLLEDLQDRNSMRQQEQEQRVDFHPSKPIAASDETSEGDRTFATINSSLCGSFETLTVSNDFVECILMASPMAPLEGYKSQKRLA